MGDKLMQKTEWKFRIYLFMRVSDITELVKDDFVSIFVDNGSMESAADERKMFDSVTRLSMSGEEPAQVYGVNTAAKTDMRDGFKALLDTLPDARYVVVANTTLPSYADGEFILTNFDVDPLPVGKVVTWDQALNFLNREFGLIVIQPPDEFEAASLMSRMVDGTKRMATSAVDWVKNAWNTVVEKVKSIL